MLHFQPMAIRSLYILIRQSFIENSLPLLHIYHGNFSCHGWNIGQRYWKEVGFLPSQNSHNITIWTSPKLNKQKTSFACIIFM